MYLSFVDGTMQMNSNCYNIKRSCGMHKKSTRMTHTHTPLHPETRIHPVAGSAAEVLKDVHIHVQLVVSRLGVQKERAMEGTQKFHHNDRVHRATGSVTSSNFVFYCPCSSITVGPQIFVAVGPNFQFLCI